MSEKKWRAVKSSGGGGGGGGVAGSGGSSGVGGGSGTGTGSGLFRLKFRRPESRSRSASQSHRHSDMGSSESGVGASGGGSAGGGTNNASVDLSQNVHLWGNDEVAVWLESLQLEEYRDDFIRHDIRGSELLTLERRDLKELGIHKVGHIKRIQQAILEIKENAHSSHPSS